MMNHWYLPAVVGAVTAFGIDLDEWMDWRKRAPGTKYDYALAIARVLKGTLAGLVAGLGITGAQTYL